MCSFLFINEWGKTKIKVSKTVTSIHAYHNFQSHSQLILLFELIDVTSGAKQKITTIDYIYFNLICICGAQLYLSSRKKQKEKT